MKRAKITRTDGRSSMAEMDDPTQWIADGIAGNWWGKPERPEIDEMGEPTGVILPAEYTVEIEDISAEHALKQVIANRRAEYPSAEDFLNAFFDGGQAALDALQVQRLAIKAKYPKP